MIKKRQNKQQSTIISYNPTIISYNLTEDTKNEFYTFLELDNENVKWMFEFNPAISVFSDSSTTDTYLKSAITISLFKARPSFRSVKLVEALNLVFERFSEHFEILGLKFVDPTTNIHYKTDIFNLHNIYKDLILNNPEIFV